MAPSRSHLLLLLGGVAFASSFLVYYLIVHRRKAPTVITSEEYKPQLRFRTVLADNSNNAFVHLRTKDTGTAELHPFYDEIQYILEHPPKPTTITSVDKDSLDMTDQHVWVETEDQLEKLACILSHEHEFAVDIEQHSLRSFRGFIALVQISTRNQDFLIDTLALHDSMFFLRKVFADPAICKVFHGADSDSLWLQRDFHIYIVNLFDTARACDVLGKPQRSLAYLLQTYCGIATNKLFQRADWRLRPLPDEMVQYACTDVHYLLYIADCLRSELLQGGANQQTVANVNVSTKGFPSESLFEECVCRSNSICLQLYEKDAAYTSSATAAASLLSRFSSNQKGLPQPERNLKEFTRFREIVHLLCAWRDTIARAQDENPRFVLSDQAILALAKNAPFTADMICKIISTVDEAVHATEVSHYMTPIPSPSPLVLRYIDSLSNIFRQSPGQSDYYSQDFLNQYVESLIVELAKNELSSATFFDLNIGMNTVSRVTSKVTGDLMTELKESQQFKSRQFTHMECRVPRRFRINDAEVSRMRFVKKFSCKAPVYHNCRIFAGDGRLLCYCDRKKLDWYVDRGLAEFIDENPPAIKLLFEPKGRPEDENNEFYIQSKSNRCVGCGESSHYLRYRVIPSCYRQHFPEHLKSHRSHDIVLLCVDCHEKAHRAAERYKKQVSIEFGVPLFARKVVDSGNEAEVLVDEAGGGVSPIQLRTAAMALLRHGQTMPKERREQLEEVISSFYGGRDVTEQDIQAALLVGKCPRELRRLRKKRGLSVDSVAKIYGDRERMMYEVHQQQVETTKVSVNGDLQVHEESFVASDSNDQTVNVSSSAIGIEQNGQNPQGHVVSANYGNYANESTVSDVADSQHMQKTSLLGHGPHGKRVVEILLEQEGEEGIRQFCQRWRAVFVEALQPAFLPSGWDVLHSGRREFGEFSVYNPIRKAK